MAVDAADLPCPSRRAFLRGRIRPASAPLRPPWALAEGAFLQACTGCNACVETCPERVLVRGDGGHPRFDPEPGECTFCGRCVDACDTGALDRAGADAPWTLTATIGDSCLAAHGVVCSSCRDACGESAIAFPPARVAEPKIDTSRCTGCGACVGACPVSALSLSHCREENRHDR